MARLNSRPFCPSRSRFSVYWTAGDGVNRVPPRARRPIARAPSLEGAGATEIESETASPACRLSPSGRFFRPARLAGTGPSFVRVTKSWRRASLPSFGVTPRKRQSGPTFPAYNAICRRGKEVPMPPAKGSATLFRPGPATSPRRRRRKGGRRAAVRRTPGMRCAPL